MRQPEFFNLKQIVGQVQRGQLSQAQWAMRRLGLELPPNDGSPPDLVLYQLMLQALSKRMNHASVFPATNLYLRDDAVPQIRLFDIMASRFPLISESRKIANAMLDAMLPPAEDSVTLLSIGIGSAQQEADFLERLAQRKNPPRRITVVGLEPATASLEAAQQTLRETAAALKLDFEFLSLCKPVEELLDADLEGIRQRSGALLISESFALHHAGRDTEGNELRDRILRQLNSLKPQGFVLIEPNSNHVTPNLKERFQNCWSHFALVFRVIDRLDVEIEVKEAIKRVFFGREIEDILGSDELERHERHETVDQWLERLHNAGFVSCDYASFAQTADLGIITVQNYDTHIGLDVVGQTVVAIIGVK
jgi:hypothetical protein